MSPSLFPALLALVSAALPTLAWNFTLSRYPTECGSLTLSWTGGTAPHTFSFLALAGLNTSFPEWTSGGRVDISPDQSGTVVEDFILPFAAGTPLVVVGSDADGFASGGTSDVYTVEPSDTGDSSCVNTYDNEAYLELVPFWGADPPEECATMVSVFYNVQLPVVIDVVIPGGESFVVVSPPLTNGTNNTDGFNPPTVYTLYWDMVVPEGIDVAYIVQDAEGQLFVSGLTTVGAGNTTCTQDGAYTVTDAPAAGAVATSTSEDGVNVGAIAGGVAGGVGGSIALIGLGVFLLHRRNRRKRQEKLKRNIKLLSYPASQKPRLQGGDKEGWVKMGDGYEGGEAPGWGKEEALKAPERAARFEQNVQV
ncbi:hypothetical protein CALCODRAFT_499837 [Calocera cornea HHB12733]|uniref:Mid2 domain-containing protein n=1 Tax=Calocera cornea HHB12733 TaxID=1353952 RepID=A0A165EBE8_9BASI|nr:hypothetical protein CALCODRAFT_499837 [Calocera cornea HHB12733]